MATYDDVSTQNITVMGICGAVGTFVIIIGLQSMYYRFESQEYQRKVVTAPTVGPDSTQRVRLDRSRTTTRRDPHRRCHDANGRSRKSAENKEFG